MGLLSDCGWCSGLETTLMLLLFTADVTDEVVALSLQFELLLSPAAALLAGDCCNVVDLERDSPIVKYYS
jgi:hypothetical protein